MGSGTPKRLRKEVRREYVDNLLNNHELDPFLKDIRPVLDAFLDTADWYDDHAKRPMILFRFFGSAVILLSVSVPFLTSLPTPPTDSLWKDSVISIVALAIAALTGLNAFFQWQTQWQGFRRAQFALEFILSQWYVDVLRARQETDEQKKKDAILEATTRLMNGGQQVVSAETGDFFKAIQLPATT